MIELSLYVQRRISRSEVEKALEMMVEVEGVHELREKKRRSYGYWREGGLSNEMPDHIKCIYKKFKALCFEVYRSKNYNSVKKKA